MLMHLWNYYHTHFCAGSSPHTHTFVHCSCWLQGFWVWPQDPSCLGCFWADIRTVHRHTGWLCNKADSVQVVGSTTGFLARWQMRDLTWMHGPCLDFGWRSSPQRPWGRTGCSTVAHPNKQAQRHSLGGIKSFGTLGFACENSKSEVWNFSYLLPRRFSGGWWVRGVYLQIGSLVQRISVSTRKDILNGPQCECEMLVFMFSFPLLVLFT